MGVCEWRCATLWYVKARVLCSWLMHTFEQHLITREHIEGVIRRKNCHFHHLNHIVHRLLFFTSHNKISQPPPIDIKCVSSDCAGNNWTINSRHTRTLSWPLIHIGHVLLTQAMAGLMIHSMICPEHAKSHDTRVIQNSPVIGPLDLTQIGNLMPN